MSVVSRKGASEMKTCDFCGETKWGDKMPDTDSVCLCDEEKGARR